MLCDQCEKEYHVGCLRESRRCDLKTLPPDKWFCCDHCDMIHGAIQGVVANRAAECFDPVIAKCGRDLIPVMVYG
ncbi:zinc finger, PHD-type containing protein [Tanacetum coccineum]